MNITSFNGEINKLVNEIYNVLYFNHNKIKLKKLLNQTLFYINKISKNNIDVDKTTLIFINELPKIKTILNTDLKATYIGDPACKDYQEIILSYPGFYATFIYRIAHFFFKNNIDYLPRILSEYAHNKTGIDINPCSKIGSYFFIDHGTGVVIGETAIIGHHVKIYQGVTYKEGYYESLVISIGEAKGDNFWCVLFPNFCLIDTQEDHTYKSYFKELINKIF